MVVTSEVAFGDIRARVCCYEVVRKPLLDGCTGGEGDLTGVMVWSDGYRLAEWLASREIAEQLRELSVLEIGSGTGFVSVVLGKLAKSAIITDGLVDAVGLTRQSLLASEVAVDDDNGVCRVGVLDWTAPHTSGIGHIGAGGDVSVEVMVGSEVVYPSSTSSSITGIFRLAGAVVREREDGSSSPSLVGSLVLLYVCRAVATTARLLLLAWESGWTWRRETLEACASSVWLLVFRRRQASGHAPALDLDDPIRALVELAAENPTFRELVDTTWPDWADRLIPNSDSDSSSSENHYLGRMGDGAFYSDGEEDD